MQQEQQQQQQQQQPRSRFSFAKQHEIAAGRVVARGGGTPLDGKVCLIGRHPLRAGSTIAHAELALEPTRNPPPPGFLRHLALIAGDGDEVLFVDILDSYAAVANGFVRALQLPAALEAFGEVIAPGGEAWIGPAACVPSSLIPHHVLAAVVGGSVPTYTTTASAAPPGSALGPAPRGDAVFLPRYWRCELINWGARAPFEVACNASVHATEVEAVIFEMAGPAGDTTHASNGPQQGSSRRGFGVRQYTYQHRPHDPPVRRAAAADGHVHTLKSPEEGLLAAAATMREMAADHFDFRDVTFTGPSKHRREALLQAEVLESSQSTPSAGTSSTTPPLPTTPVTEQGGPEAAAVAARPKRAAALSHTLPQCAKVVLSDGNLRRCYLDPRRVVGVAVGDVVAVFQSQPRATPTADQSNPGLVPATENGGSTVPGPAAAGGGSGPPLPIGVGRVLQLTSWSRRRSVTQGGHLVAKRRATIHDLHADPAVAGITRVPASSLPTELAAAVADGAAPTVMYTALVGAPPTPAAFIEVDAKTFHQQHPAPQQDAPGSSSHYPPLDVAGIGASAVHRIARQRRGGSAAQPGEPAQRQHSAHGPDGVQPAAPLTTQTT